MPPIVPNGAVPIGTAPAGIRVGLLMAVGLLILGGAAAWVLLGPAILLDLATGAAGLLCL